MRLQTIVGLALAAWLVALPAAAQPGLSGDTVEVILPGNEDAATELLAAIDRSALGEYAWRGPGIEVSNIHFWLMRGEDVRAELILVPRALGLGDSPTSESFAIEATWAGAEPSGHERALVDAAVASIQAHDRGGFYVDRQARPSADQVERSPEQRAQVARRWRLGVGAVALIGLVGAGVTLRRVPSRGSDD